MARTQKDELLNTLQAGFKYIENDIQNATIKHNEFLKQLGLPPLP